MVLARGDRRGWTLRRGAAADHSRVQVRRASVAGAAARRDAESRGREVLAGGRLRGTRAALPMAATAPRVQPGGGPRPRARPAGGPRAVAHAPNRAPDRPHRDRPPP